MDWLERQRLQCGGISLLDLLFSLLVIATLLGAGVPAFNWLVLDTRRTADINALVASIQLARSEAAKLGVPVVVCKTVDQVSCGGNEIGYEAGWMVFAAADGGDRPALEPGEVPIYSYSPETEGSIRSNRSLYIFKPYYRRSTNGTITFCDRRGSAAARAVIVSYTGRPRVTDRSPGGRELVCGTMTR